MTPVRRAAWIGPLSCHSPSLLHRPRTPAANWSPHPVLEERQKSCASPFAAPPQPPTGQGKLRRAALILRVTGTCPGAAAPTLGRRGPSSRRPDFMRIHPSCRHGTRQDQGLNGSRLSYICLQCWSFLTPPAPHYDESGSPSQKSL